MTNGIHVFLKLICSGAGLLIGWLYGAPDALLLVLITMMVLDYITGVTAAFAKKELSSAVGFKGIARKMLILIIAAVASLVDKVIPGLNGALRGAVCLFYIANEGLSILENAGRLGLKIPEILRKALVKAEKKE